MPDVSVDNTPITVALSENETFTPSAGNVVRVKITAGLDGEADIVEGGSSVVDVADGGSSNRQSSVTVVLTDSVTVKSSSFQIYISGFVL